MLKSTASSFRPVQMLVPCRGTRNMKISREELYRRVWEKPVRTLAKEFDISDVWLAKVCRKLQIPLPPVGHWMKVQHGKVVKQPALPPSDSKDVVIKAQPHRFRKPSLLEVQALATKVVELDFTVPARALICLGWRRHHGFCLRTPSLRTQCSVWRDIKIIFLE